MYENLIKALIMACAPILTFFLLDLIRTKSNSIKSNDKFVEKINYIEIAEQAVIDVVIALNQTIVDAAKLEGKFDKAKQMEVFMRAKNDIQVILSAKTKEVIRELYGDVDVWLDTKIEAAVNEYKIEFETLGV